MVKYFKGINEEQIARKHVALTKFLINIAESFGYLFFETPIIHEKKTLCSKYVSGQEIVSEIYGLECSDNIGLRYDLTLPLMAGIGKKFANNYRRFEIGRVFRNGPTNFNSL